MIFQAPALLGALALIAVPIIIHIINKRKFRVVEWGPMRYLRQSLKTTRRRIRLEQLLLLLTRILFVAALVMAVARPVARSEGAFGFAGTGARSTRVIVLDDSLSMGRKSGALASLDLARAAVTSVVDAAGPRDLITVLRSTMPGEPLLRGVERRSIEDLRAVLAACEVSDAAPNWAGLLDEVRRRFEASPFPVGELTIVTDLQVAGWDDSVREAARRAAGENRSCRIVDVGLEGGDNAVLVEFKPLDPVVVPGVETRLRARIRNDGVDPYGPLEAELKIGEARRTVSIPRIEAGAEVEVPITHRFANAGLVPLTLSLPDDSLPGDNRRPLLVEVREQIDLLLVDGDPSNLPFESETDFLAVAFTIGEIPWRVYGEIDSEWLGHAPVPHDLTVLANLAAAGPEQVEALEAQVRAGMGLIVFPGDQCDAALLDQAFYREGKGLLPARPLGVNEEPVRGLVVEPGEDSPLAPLAALAPEALNEIGAKRRLALEMGGDADTAAAEVRVLARWDDEEGSPAVLERRFGRGRVLLFTTTADRAWSDWPVDPTFLLSIREASLRVADPGLEGLNGEVGPELLIRTGSTDALGAGLRRPGEDEDRQPELRRRGNDEEELILALADATQAGVYRAAWTDEKGLAATRAVALGPSLAESQSQRLGPDELRERLAPLKPELVHHSRLAEALAGEGQELWRFFLGAMLALLALETALMLWVGRKG